MKFDRKSAVAKLESLEAGAPLVGTPAVTDVKPETMLQSAPSTEPMDVKVGSAPALVPPADSAKEASSTIQEPEETLLQELEDRKIPYKRFKEVNDKLKSLEQELKTKTRERELELENERLRLKTLIPSNGSQSPQGLETTDESLFGDETVSPQVARQLQVLREAYLKQQDVINRLSQTTEQEKLERELAKHKEVYEYADETAVLGYKKVMPERSLEDLMRYDHEKKEAFLKNHLQSLLNKKKLQSQKLVTETKEGVSSGSMALKKPKTMKDASKAMSAWIRNQK